MCQIILKHVLVMKAKHSMLEIKHFVRERVGSVIDHDDLNHEQTMVIEMNLNFRIAGLPHSVVKQAQSGSV